MRDHDEVVGQETRGAASVQSLGRALELLEALQRHGPSKLEDLARMHGVHKTTTLRLLQTLEQFGYVARCRGRGEFQLGLRCRELGAVVDSRMARFSSARAVMNELAIATGETIDLAVYESGAMVLIESIAGRPAGRVGVSVGTRVPATCTTTGKLRLASMPASELERVLTTQGMAQRGPKSITDRGHFLAELERVRALGYATNDEESDAGMRFVGVVIDVPDIADCAALILGAPMRRLPRSEFPFIAEMLRTASEKIAASVA